MTLLRRVPDGGRISAAAMAAVLLALMVLPLVALLASVSPAEIASGVSHELFAPALVVSLRTTLISLALIAVTGTPLAWWLAVARGRGARLVDLVIDLPIVIPPAVIGIALLQTFGRRGMLGPALGAAGISVPFTSAAVVLAQLVIAAPLYVRAAANAFRSVEPDLMVVARTLGASPAQAFLRVAAAVALPGLLAGAALAWSRALGEFGATLLFAGNRPKVTQTMPLAIYQALEVDVRAALALSLVLAAAAVVLLLVLRLAPAALARQRRGVAGATAPADAALARPTAAAIDRGSAAVERQTGTGLAATGLPPTEGAATTGPPPSGLAATGLPPTGLAATGLPPTGPATTGPPPTGPAVAWRVAVQAVIGPLALDVELDGGRRPTVIIGPNGSGKTTLLRLIAGTHPAVAGRIDVAGRILLDSGNGQDLPPEQRGVGYVPQGFGLFPHLRVIDNVAFGLTVRRRTQGADRRAAALRMLADLECDHLAQRMPGQLSGGERQRVALARALLVEPKILLLDEPLAALDVAARRSVRGFLAARLQRHERPAIVVTHDVRDVLAFDPQVYVLEQGRVAQRGSVAELRARPATPFVAELFAELAVGAE